MVVKNGWHRFLQIAFTVLVIVAFLFVSRSAVVMTASPFVMKEAQKGNYAPANLYYNYLWFTGDFMEPYKALYNLGTSYAQYEDYEKAEQYLEFALAKADYIYGECYIRNNLAIVQEKRGDYYTTSNLEELADSYYQKAVQTIQDAPPACFPPPPMSSDSESDGGDNESEDSNDGEGTPGDPSDPAEPSDMSETGEEMEKTEKSSQGKSDEIQDGKDGSGKQQVQQEKDQSAEDQQNQNDQAEQEQNSDDNSVQKPW